MFNKQKVRELFGLVGFKPFSNTTIPESLNANLQESRSGIMVNDKHALLTPENIWKIKPTVNELNTYLQEIYYTSINDLLSVTFTKKKTEKVTKSIFEDRNMFKGAGRFLDLENKQGRFVGFKITPHQYKNIVIRINRIGVQFTQLENIPFYLYKEGTKEPLQTFNIQNPLLSSFYWHTENLLLEFDDHTNYPAGSYYLGYYEDDLTGQAVKRNLMHHSERKNCGYCNNYEYDSFRLYGKYFKVQPIEVANGGLDGTNLFDIGQVAYSSTNNYGLNLSFSVFCDLSRFIIQNEDVLADALAFQIGLKLLESFAYNIEVSGDSARLAQLAMVALDSDKNGNVGYRKMYENFVKGLDFDFSDLSSPCLPKGRSKGIKLGTI